MLKEIAYKRADRLLNERFNHQNLVDFFQHSIEIMPQTSALWVFLVLSTLAGVLGAMVRMVLRYLG